MDKSFKEKIIVGCDEVGRGPLAGPVNGCAVKIDSRQNIEIFEKAGVTDSKKLTDKKRQRILELLKIDISKIQVGEVYHCQYEGASFDYCVEELDNVEIDKINILQASLKCMQNASFKLIKSHQDLNSHEIRVLIDGNKTFESSVQVESVVKGDSKSIAIGLASIIAKVFRDEKMKEYDRQYPGYGLAKHAGYPTKEHKLAIEKLGPTKIHRRSFKGVKEFC